MKKLMSVIAIVLVCMTSVSAVETELQSQEPQQFEMTDHHGGHWFRINQHSGERCFTRSECRHEAQYHGYWNYMTQHDSWCARHSNHHYTCWVQH